MSVPPPGRPVVVVGDLLTDVVARLSGPLQSGSDAAAAVLLTAGGSAANTAAWLASDGIATTLVARRGDDPAGREREQELRSYGVLPRLAVDPARPTGTVVALVDTAGERTMVTDRAASAHLQPADIPVDVLVPPAHLHLSGYALLGDRSRAAGLAALALAGARGLSRSVGAASSAPLRAAGPDRFLADTRGVDLLIANLDECRVLAGVDDPAAGAGRLLAHYRAVVVTCGAAGAVGCDATGPTAVPAAPARVVDSTGAGDAFAAGLLGSWLAGATLAVSMWAGSRLAAVAVAAVGSRRAPE